MDLMNQVLLQWNEVINYVNPIKGKSQKGLRNAQEKIYLRYPYLH